MALAGFLTFGEKTEGNILNNFPDENLVVNIARLSVYLIRTVHLLLLT